MEQISISEKRYEELLKYEEMVLSKRIKNTKSADVVMSAIKATLWESTDGKKRVHMESLREEMKKLYLSGGDRARAKALKNGLEKLIEQGKITFSEQNKKMFFVSE